MDYVINPIINICQKSKFYKKVKTQKIYTIDNK